MGRSHVRWLLLALAASPALLTLWGILSYGVDYPRMDQWMPDIAGPLIKFHNGNLSLGDFWAQHNEHRILVPRLIYFLLGVLTRWNTVAEMVAGWAIVCGTSIGILCLILRTTGGEAAARGLARLDGAGIFMWFICNLLLFGLTQWENWLSGIGVQNFSPMAFIVWAVVIASSKLRIWPKTGMAIALASAATYSSGNGVLAWPMAGAVLAWSDSLAALKTKKWALAAWLGACLLNIALYAINYQVPPPPPAVADNPQTSFTGLLYYNMAFLGNAFTFSNPDRPMLVSTVAGSLMFILLLASLVYFLNCWMARHYEFGGWLLIWLAIAGFSIFSGFIASVFRAQFGIAQAVSSRYVTFSIYLPVALVNLVPLICADLRRRSAAPALDRAGAMLGSALIVLCVMSLPQDLEAFHKSCIIGLRGKAELLLMNILSDREKLKEDVCNDPALVYATAPILNEMGYLRPRLLTREDVAPAGHMLSSDTDDSYGRSEGISPSGPQKYTVSGWAFLPDKSEPAHAVFLSYEDPRGQPVIFAVADLVAERPDIARAHGSRYLWSGWMATFPLNALPADVARFKIWAWAMDVETGRAYRLDNPITGVRPAP